MSAAGKDAQALAADMQAVARQDRERFEREAVEAAENGRKAGEEARREQAKKGGF